MASSKSFNLPGRGIGNPGRGTLKGGTITGGNAGMAAVGCGTVWGNATGSGCGPVTAGAFTATTGVTATEWGVVTADESSGPSGTVKHQESKLHESKRHII